MKRRFATLALLGLVAATALFAQTDDRDKDGRKAELAKKREQVAELREKAESQRARALAAQQEAEERDTRRKAEAQSDRDDAKPREARETGGAPNLDRKLAELNRLIEDLHRGGQRDRAEQLQRQAQEIVQQLRSGKIEAASERIEQILDRQGPESKRPEKAIIRTREERPDQDDRKERAVDDLDNKLDQARRHVAELMAQGKREEAEAVERKIREYLRNRAAGAAGETAEKRGDSIEHRIRELRESGKLEEAERLQRELRRHLELEHGEREHAAAAEREHAAERSNGERIRHLREAAEHLHAAGLHEQAEQVLRHAQGLLQQQEGRGQAEQFERHMRELASHLEQVSDRLSRLEAVVGKLVNDEKDDDDKDDDKDDD